ncbi:hypothetical protein L5G32_18910 [Gordonia sp. HY002]|uniref:hypothetical protein n=1 Tax=Gordonia zhenghanii TaxID=2911516 RepID=UPI001EF09992|nr:hypothetical protein [Gordonia zhenghanii]MCF8572330.1 hypothetical protein [Gordonia zhenghanii]MCF8607310.1 hypothetical protein [Gordonia zhenghanii]
MKSTQVGTRLTIIAASITIGTYLAVVVCAFIQRWSADRVGPLITAGAATVTLAGLVFAWWQAKQASEIAEVARRDAERNRRLQAEYQRRHAGMKAVVNLIAIAERMEDPRFRQFFTTTGLRSEPGLRAELQALVHSATPQFMLINFSHTGQAAMRGFGNAQRVLDRLPRDGDDVDGWEHLRKVWANTGTWLMTTLPWGTAEFSVDPEDVEKFDQPKPPQVRYTWELDDDDYPPSV